MKDLRKLIEQLNKLTEEDVNEINLQDEIEPEQPAEVIDAPVEKPVFGDNMSLADQFDAKARIARALEGLQNAVEEFKDATAEKVDLLKDQALTGGIEKLTALMGELETALVSGSNILGTSELNDPFKTDMPAPQEEVEEVEQTGDAEDAEELDMDAEDEEEYDFDAAAGLDLLADEE